MRSPLFGYWFNSFFSPLRPASVTRLALSAQKRVRQNFSLDKMGQQFDSLLRQFVARDANDG
jgi:hypothetical protein